MKSIFFLRGRVAFKFGLKHLKFNKGDQLFVPSMICDVLIEELDQLGVKPIYYKIDEKFNVDWKDIKEKFSKKIKGILMVHFFGKPQNLYKFKKFCQKKKIYLIEDNCHGFKGLKNIKLSGDITISSPYKVMNEINNGGILFINNKPNNFNIDLVNIKQNNQSIINFLMSKFKTNKLIKNIFRYFFIRPDYESKSVEKKIKIQDSLLDEKTIAQINKFSFKKEKKLRLKRFNVWKKIIKKYNFKPYFNYTKNDNYILWYLVVEIKDYTIRKKIYDWGWNNNIDIVSWPSFPKEISKKQKIYNFSRKFVLFPIDKDFKNEIKRFEY